MASMEPVMEPIMEPVEPMDVVSPFYVSAVVISFTVPINGYLGVTHTLPSYGSAREMAEALRDGNFTVTLRTTQVVEEQI